MKGGLIRETPSHIKAAMAKATEESRALTFLLLLARAGLPTPWREVEIHPTRRWRVDFVWMAFTEPGIYGVHHHGVIVESEGGVHSGGRHSRGRGIEDDLERSNELQLLGYTVLRVPSHKLATSETVDLVRRALQLPPR